MKKFFFFSAILYLIAGFTIAQYKGTNKDLGPAPGKYHTGIKGDIEIPFEMYCGKPRFEAKINGQNVHLTIDNGRLWDETWLFGGPNVEALKLKKKVNTENVTGSGTGDGVSTYSTEPITILFPGIEFTEQPNLVSPGMAIYFKGFEGQICNTFFKHFIVEMNFDKKKIILHRPEDFKYKGNGDKLPMMLMSNGAYSIPLAIQMEDGLIINAQCDIDLGGSGHMSVNMDFNKDIKLPSRALEMVFGYGASGPIKGHKGRIKNLKIGKYEFSDLLVNFGKGDVISADSLSCGIIGLPLFKRFNVTFDYLNSCLYLEPNKYYNVESEFDMTGFEYNNDFTIRKIYSNSPAEEAGIKTGDKVIKINGENADGKDLWKYYDLFRMKGEELKILIQRNGEEKEVVLKLRRII